MNLMQMDATLSRVQRGLSKYHKYSTDAAIALVEKHKDIVASGVRVASCTYYVIDKILAQEEDHFCEHGCVDWEAEAENEDS